MSAHLRPISELMHKSNIVKRFLLHDKVQSAKKASTEKIGYDMLNHC